MITIEKHINMLLSHFNAIKLKVKYFLVTRLVDDCFSLFRFAMQRLDQAGPKE